MQQCLDPNLPVRILGAIRAGDEFGATSLDYQFACVKVDGHESISESRSQCHGSRF